MDYLSLVQRLHRESLRSTPAPTTVATTDVRQLRLVERIADAWRELQSERDWKWRRETLDVALTANKQTYTGADLGATNFGRWREQDADYSPIVYLDGSPNTYWSLSFTPLDWFRRRWVYINVGGSTPLEWSVDEEQSLMLGPKPLLSTFKLRIEQWKEPFELGTVNPDPNLDEPDMPVRFHLWLVWRALQDIAKDDANPELLASAEKRADEMKDKILFDQARLPHL